MKRLYCFLLIASSLMVLAACGSETTEGSNAEYTLRLGVTQNEQNAEYQAIFQFKEAVEERTEGAIEVETYHSDQLASIPDLIEQASVGADVGTVTDAAQLSDLKKSFLSYNLHLCLKIRMKSNSLWTLVYIKSG